MSKPLIIIAIAFALAGCESTVTDDGDIGGAPSTCEGCQPAECPDQQPASGDPCDAAITCGYTELQGTECDEHSVEVTFMCRDLEWVEISARCSEYEPQCPSQLPVNGTPCDWEDDDAGTCEYDLESLCEPSDVAEANCDLEAGVWQVTMPNGSCADCGYVNGAECAAASGCAWLTPRCDAGEVFEPFCAPTLDCAVDGCAGQDVCVEYAVNACWASELEPVCCEGIAGVCEAPPPGND